MLATNRSWRLRANHHVFRRSDLNANACPWTAVTTAAGTALVTVTSEFPDSEQVGAHRSDLLATLSACEATRVVFDFRSTYRTSSSMLGLIVSVAREGYAVELVNCPPATLRTLRATRLDRMLHATGV